jgi:2-polyprenyl-3-methyl-5-hydroxy-6-metoxy-1,4-benzoquinol methylase
MSMLMNVLRSALSGADKGKSAPPVGEVPPGAATSQPEDAAPSGPPAWRLLGEQPGEQETDYGDIARPGVQKLFGHQPRRLLDIGCASGAVGAGLKRMIPGLWVWGCDLNERSARSAAAQLDHVTSVPRAQWDAADLERVGSVDTVLLLDVLEHMYNPWAELEFLSQRLPREAQVIVSMPNVGHISTLNSLAEGKFQYEPLGILDIAHVRFFTFKEMMAMFEQTGFEVEQEWVLNGAPDVQIERFPAQVESGKISIVVETAEEWERLNAVQFGFRLKPRAAAV